MSESGTMIQEAYKYFKEKRKKNLKLDKIIKMSEENKIHQLLQMQVNQQEIHDSMLRQQRNYLGYKSSLGTLGKVIF